MANHSFWEVFIASSLACGVTTLGIYLISRREDWGRKYSAYFMSFAAGVLVSISLVHITPESFGLSAAAPACLLAGFLTLYLVNRFLSSYLCHERETAYEIGLIPMIGIGFHSFIDGVIYSVTFQVSFFTGAGAAIGMILHEFPEGILTFVLLKRGGLPHNRSIFYAFFPPRFPSRWAPSFPIRSS